MAYSKKSTFRKSKKTNPQLLSMVSSKKMAKGRTFKSMDPYGVKPEPFPRVLLTRCKYSAAGVRITPLGVDVTAGNTYRLNSIWDPLFAVGGRTVTGHAQLASIYGKYWVMGAKVSVSFNNPKDDGIRVGCRLRIEGGTTSLAQNLSTVSEQPMCYLQGLNDSGSQRKTFNFYVKPWTLCAVSKLEYLANSERYSSVINGNPLGAVNSCVMDVFAVDPNSATNTVDYNIKIEYFTKFYSRTPLLSTGIV